MNPPAAATPMTKNSGIPRALVPLSEHDSTRIECGIALA